jgi:hypothetical protein
LLYAITDFNDTLISRVSFYHLEVSIDLSAKMLRAANPPTLKSENETTFAEKPTGSDTESVSGYGDSKETSSGSEDEESAKTLNSEKDNAKNGNLKPQKIKVASNYQVESRIITSDVLGGKYYHPEIVIVRETNDGKSSEFNFDINVAPKIVIAIKIIMKRMEIEKENAKNGNLKPQKIRAALNYQVESRIITSDVSDGKYYYPEIVIVYRMNDGKSSEFNFNINVAPRIAIAIEIIMKRMKREKEEENFENWLTSRLLRM